MLTVTQLDHWNYFFNSFIMTRTPITSYNEKRVIRSEKFFRKNIKEELNPMKNNGPGRRFSYDIWTNVGSFDAQYYTSDQLQYVDFLSGFNHIESCVLPDGKKNRGGGDRDNDKFWGQVNDMNKAIRVWQGLNYTFAEIFDALREFSNNGQITPGKLMNPDKYEYVGFVKYKGKSLYIEDYRVLDLKKLRSVPSTKVTIAFNLKDKWNSLNDYHHSAYIKFPQKYINAADVTEKFMKPNPNMYAT